MPRDLPDWDALTAQATIGEVTDLGELAVRLGSVVTHDRRGDVLWLDDFENAVTKWASTFAGTGDTFGLSMERVRNGLFSALMTAGAVTSPKVTMFRELPFPVLSPFGLEVSFNFVGQVIFLEFTLQLDNGVNRVIFNVRWSDAANELQYLNSDNVWVSLSGTLTPFVSPTIFHTLKLVVDGKNNEYARVLYDDSVFLLPNVGALVSAVAVDPHATITLTLIGRDGDEETVYIDDVILTQNENV